MIRQLAETYTYSYDNENISGLKILRQVAEQPVTYRPITAIKDHHPRLVPLIGGILRYPLLR